MFIQVIRGTTSDREGLLRQGDRWQDELRPGATGFLGSTGGVTDDGRFVQLARFESEEAARANSARDQQGDWWTDTEKYLEGVAFDDSVGVLIMLGGGSDDAGFVQVMRGRVVDPDKLATIAPPAEFEAALRRHRPDVLGQVIVMHPDDTYTEVVYFTSEAAARRGEATEAPAEMQVLYAELSSAITVDEYLDLKDPWLR